MTRLQRIEKDFGTLYAFRGPRTHRLVTVFIAAPEYGRFREQEALARAARQVSGR